MKKICLLSALLCLSATSYSIDTLPTIQVEGRPLDSHLTTRIAWVKFPSIHYKMNELKHQDRSAVIRIKADETGQVIHAKIQESTGIAALDQKLINAVMLAKVKPYSQADQTFSTVGYQVFNFRLDDALDHATNPQCSFQFNSKLWLNQIADRSTAFRYLQQPQLAVDSALLKNKDRTIKFRLKINRNGEVQQVKLIRLSGVNAIDQQVIQAVEHAKLHVKRTYKTFWLYKPRTLSDEIHFSTQDCES